jgi:hypothetical protein
MARNGRVGDSSACADVVADVVAGVRGGGMVVAHLGEVVQLLLQQEA